MRMDRVLVQPQQAPFQHRNAQPDHLRDPPHPVRPGTLTPRRRCPRLGGSSSLRTAAESWLSEVPTRRTVTWQHHISKPLIWDNDSVPYSTSKLAYEIVLAA